MTIDASMRALSRLRLDERIAPLRSLVPNLVVPGGGWLRAIRQALGMSATTLASRLNIAIGGVARLEQSEQKGTIQLDSLRRAADALDCDVVYILIPRVPLDLAVANRRRELAQLGIARVRHHMALENQATANDGAIARWREEQAAADVRDRDLWPPEK
jgi:predicted DNA-binding mobile mystery protein A